MNRVFKTTCAVITSALLLTGCGSSSTAAATSASSKKSSDSKTLRVGMECNYAPFNWTTSKKNDTAQPLDGGDYCDGYDVVIATKLAEKTGKKVEVHKLDWDNLILNLNHNQIDAIIAGMTDTKEREKQVNFTSPYYESEEVIIVKKDGKYANADDIQDFSGAKVQGQMNTIYDEVIDQIKGVNHMPAAETFPAAIQALQSGGVDGVVSELPVAKGVVEANKDLSIVRFAKGKNFDADTTVSIAVRKSDSKLQKELEDALKTISKDEREKLMEEAVDRQPASN